jgi:hypothetical protein
VRTLGVGIALALGTAVAAAAAGGSPLTPGGHESTDAWSVLFLAAAAIGFVLYLAALALLRSGRGSVIVVCALTVVIQTVPLAGPLLLSRDAYSYWAYGRIVLAHDGDPYVNAPAKFPRDPATRAVARGWRETTSVYGPAFTAASVAVAAVSGTSRVTAAFLFRALAAFAVMATAFLAACLAFRKAFAAAFVGWNPLLALHFAGGGHNDAWMIGALLGALVLTARRRNVAAGSAWIAAAAIKASALLLLPLALVRSRRGVVVGVLAAGAGLVIAATLSFGTAWLSGFGGLQTREAAFSIPSRLAQLGLGESTAFSLARAGLVVGMIWLAVEAARGRVRLALGACLVLVTSPWILPWYAIWPVGLAAAEEDGLAQVLAIALAMYVLPDRVPM